MVDVRLKPDYLTVFQTLCPGRLFLSCNLGGGGYDLMLHTNYVCENGPYLTETMFPGFPLLMSSGCAASELPGEQTALLLVKLTAYC